MLSGHVTERELQDYQSVYIDIYNSLRPQHGEPENINDDVVFELELIRQIEVNIDHILLLVQKYHDSNCQDKETSAIFQEPSIRRSNCVLRSNSSRTLLH